MKKYKEVIIFLLFLIPFLLLFVFHLFDIFIYIVYFIFIFPFLLIKLGDKKRHLFYFILLVFAIINLYNGNTNLIPLG
ncbi:MAG: hypothetical protein PHO56_00790 [Patescibacteria group bacterium]|nr:hypothetical protein [Patescibacteria group bacterium]